MTVSNFCHLGNFHQEEVSRFIQESLKMSRFRHTHIMGLIGVCVDTGAAPFIIMPYMANGSVLQYLRKGRENLIVSEENNEDEVRTIHMHVFFK